MSSFELLNEKRSEFGPWLRRSFWLPLRRILEMFHILPITAALILFVLLATDGQLREIYVSYLEDLGSGGFGATVIRLGAAALGFALISAVLYQAQYLLSADRVTVIYATNADLAAGSRLRYVQDAAATVLALSPWLGLATGLLNAKFYLANLFDTLQKAGAPVDVMQRVPMASSWAIAAAASGLGLVLAVLVAANTKNRTLQRSIILVIPAAAAIFYLLLTDPPKMNPGVWQFVAITACVVLGIAVYYFVYHRLYTMRAHFVYLPFLQRDTGFNPRRRQRALLFVWALLPWITVVALYFTQPATTGALHSWARIPVVMSWVIATGLVVTSVLHVYKDKPALLWSIYGAIGVLAIIGLLASCLASADSLVNLYRLIGPLGTLAFTYLFMISIFALLALLSQRSGLPVLTLVILAIVCSVTLPFPMGWTVATLVILCAVIFVMAIVARFWAAAGVAFVLAVTGGVNYVKALGEPVNLTQHSGRAELVQAFNSWLNDGKKRTMMSGKGGSPALAAQPACVSKAQKYPVFIIAVEGGGIYAASAASMFLARLQDNDPCFAEHVFAISGVSGGSIGATIFQAIDRSKYGVMSMPAADQSGDCPAPVSHGDRAGIKPKLTDEVSAILQDDHFSPLVAAIFPELLGFARAGRADELAASFEHSVNTQDRDAAEELCSPFIGHWSQSGVAPALVLNATWVETGFRAAFAPFPLHAIDDSLYSFLDEDMPANDPSGQPVSLMKAAVVSARFPGVLPPYSVTLHKKVQSNAQATRQPTAKPAAQMRWNFVDGGYADSSGAATALSLYRALTRAAEKANAELHLILLTSSDPQPNPNEISGTSFADILGPIDAMLNVRDGLANAAVARACDGIASAKGTISNVTCENYANQPNSPLQIVGIEDATYGLSLGWKISQTTFGVVSWMLGEPNRSCNAETQSQDIKAQQTQDGQTADDDDLSETLNNQLQVNGKFQLNEKVVAANSCVLGSILNLLNDTPARQTR